MYVHTRRIRLRQNVTIRTLTAIDTVYFIQQFGVWTNIVIPDTRRLL